MRIKMYFGLKLQSKDFRDFESIKLGTVKI
jgi:hypothetical protein